MQARSIVLALVLLASVGFIVPVRSSSPSPSAPSGLMFDHIVTIMLENVGIADSCGRSYPCQGGNVDQYMALLANNNSLALNYATVKSPPNVTNSLPNYLAITSGQSYSSWANSDCNPSPTCSSNATNIIDRLEAAGLTWRAFAEDYPVASGCYPGPDKGPFITHHVPFNYYTDINGIRCNNIVTAGPGLADPAFLNYLNSSSQANYVWLTPNRCDDGHDQCSQVGNITTTCGASPAGGYLCQDEAYLKQIVPKILATSMFTTQRSVLFVTYDEGDNYCPVTGHSPDCVYAVFAGSGVKTHYSSTIAYGHYSALVTIETNWGLACIAMDCSALPMTEFFNQTIGINRTGVFENYSVSTTGWLGYNPARVTDGILTIIVTNASGVLSLATYRIAGQQVGGGGEVRLVLSAHVNDSSGVGLAAYLYVNVVSGIVDRFFVARNIVVDHGSTVDITDVTFIALRYGYCEGDTGYDARADIDGTGCVDLSSLSVAMITYGFPVYN